MCSIVFHKVEFRQSQKDRIHTLLIMITFSLFSVCLPSTDCDEDDTFSDSLRISISVLAGFWVS
jgi:hypothetical protein